MPSHFADRLLHAIKEKNAAACVGLDPLIERLPPSLLADVGVDLDADGALSPATRCGAACEALRCFGIGVIEAVAPHVPALKINIAFFERYGADGIAVYLALTKHAAEQGLIVIGDVKRADIGHSTTQYAHAQLGEALADGAPRPDAVTVNPYFGYDAIRPFVEIARAENRGLFVLVQTSNESAAQVQGLTLSDGTTVCQAVAGITETWASGEGLIGEQGYSCVGAVVSPRDLASTEKVRSMMPHCLFLVPGFGAQGRTANDVARCFKADGTGAIVTASRSVIYAYQDARIYDECSQDWRRAVEHGCRDLVKAIRTVVPH